eukprot:c9407_g2_i1.p1 GENE.c9407_g2_i1~~c9407_g2_i1.p1  ORF type:complete len:312 (-),score=119.17 c9407_g2_i1:11-883(-)
MAATLEDAKKILGDEALGSSRSKDAAAAKEAETQSKDTAGSASAPLSFATPPAFAFSFGSASAAPPNFAFDFSKFSQAPKFDFSKGFEAKPATAAEGENEDGPDEQGDFGNIQGPPVKPVVEVSLVQTSTGDEQDEVLYTIPRAKLYIMAPIEEIEPGKANPTNAKFGTESSTAASAATSEGDGAANGDSSKAHLDWRECGIGEVRITKYGSGKYRILMRTDKILRAILNSPILPSSNCQVLDDKHVAFVGWDEKRGMSRFMMRVKKKDEADGMAECVKKCQEAMPKTSE